MSEFRHEHPRWFWIPGLMGLACASCFDGKSPDDPLRYPWVEGRQSQPAAPPLATGAIARGEDPSPAPAAARAASSGCLDAGCHEPMRSTTGLHARIVQGACLLCHESAGAAGEHVFRPVVGDGGVCETCHPRHTTKARVHAPYEEGKCLSCHDPHAAAGAIGPAAESISVLCAKCHPPSVHEVVHGPYAAGACLACHESHQSEHVALARASSADLCVSCHDEAVESTGGNRLVTSVGRLVRTSEFLHGPVREGRCDGCHAAHGSAFANLLREPYPDAFYQPFDEARYALCFRCHARDLVTRERTTTATGFRDGDRNLHYVHVNDTKGRSCRACHEVHASDLPFHLRQRVAFGPGGWELPIGFVQAAQGGACSPGCHLPFDYDRTRTR